MGETEIVILWQVIKWSQNAVYAEHISVKNTLK